MNENERIEAKLSNEQRELVEQNLGLVGVHLHRHVSCPESPRRDREYDDLFQEGCLGLIQAALRYRPDGGVPFPAFALPRIRKAVSRALAEKFTTLQVPMRRRSRVTRTEGGCGREDAGWPRGGREREALRHDPAQDDARRRPRGRSAQDPDLPWARIGSLSHDPVDRGEKPQREPDEPAADTVGQRLRDKYERAVRVASHRLAQARSRRCDRGRLIHMLVRERFMMPQEQMRPSMRQIARETGSSYARVAQCARKLGQAVAELLRLDPEFAQLKEMARSDPRGVEATIDGDHERRLARASARAYVRRMRSARPEARVSMLDELISVAEDRLADAVERGVSSLPVDKREQLAWGAPSGGQKSR
jgi:hypothetical protein